MGEREVVLGFQRHATPPGGAVTGCPHTFHIPNFLSNQSRSTSWSLVSCSKMISEENVLRQHFSKLCLLGALHPLMFQDVVFMMGMEGPGPSHSNIEMLVLSDSQLDQLIF